MRLLTLLGIALLGISSISLSHADVTIYTAKHIRTMEPALPEATAVAVEDGRIVAVGTLDSLKPIIGLRGGKVDDRFANNVLVPGFIDPHVHPSLPAITTQFPYIAPDDWHLPTGDFPGAKTPAAYKARLTELAAKHTDVQVPFIAWGYHPLWHGEIWRSDLNDWFGDQPVGLWHRSFHELIFNDAALDMLGITEAMTQEIHEANWERGHMKAASKP